MAQKAKLLNYIGWEGWIVIKNSSLMDPFVGYEENDVLFIQPIRPHAQNFILLVTYKMAK
jgi:hypothetical protein